MANLTLGEKSHWKDRIARRIGQRIEMLVAKGDPTLLERVSKEAHKKAYESLGIASQEQELEAIEKQRAELDKREKRLLAEQLAAINGTSAEEELKSNDYYADQKVEGAVTARAKAMEAEILAESDLGRQVLSLRAEEENLLDTVWLATSSIQIKELWAQVNALLAVAPTELEKKALQIAPVEDKE